MTVLDPERRSRLLGVKLATLAREHLDLGGEPVSFRPGAALASPPRGAVLAEDEPVRSLGPALAWSQRNGVHELHLLVEDTAGLLARRAAAFSDPPAVWWIRGRELHAVEPEPHRPATPPADVGPRLRSAAAGRRMRRADRARRPDRRGPRPRGRPRGRARRRAAPARGRRGPARSRSLRHHPRRPADRRRPRRGRRRRSAVPAARPRRSTRCTGWPPSAGCATSSSPTPGSWARPRSRRRKDRCPVRT